MNETIKSLRENNTGFELLVAGFLNILESSLVDTQYYWNENISQLVEDIQILIEPPYKTNIQLKLKEIYKYYSDIDSNLIHCIFVPEDIIQQEKGKSDE